MNEEIKQLIQRVEDTITTLSFGNNPPVLYEPLRYIMQLGGKRMRPLLTLLAYNLYKNDITPALKPAVAVEVFHNFTLLHDDIMDNAPLRRGKPTVHEQWNPTIALLSGDVMLIKSYEILVQDLPDPALRRVLDAFNRCATGVCEGQQHDMNFETQQQVTEHSYLGMIEQKTAVLLGFALELGAIIGGASPENADKLHRFGVNIGIGFQLQDDLLDVYADQDKFGKQVGGDIIANKKTYLLIKALQLASGSMAQSLTHWLTATDFNPKEKVEAVTHLYNELGVKGLTEEKMNQYFTNGFEALEKLDVADERKELLITFTQWLLNRDK